MPMDLENLLASRTSEDDPDHINLAKLRYSHQEPSSRSPRGPVNHAATIMPPLSVTEGSIGVLHDPVMSLEEG